MDYHFSESKSNFTSNTIQSFVSLPDKNLGRVFPKPLNPLVTD